MDDFFTRAADTRPATWNAEARTIEAVISTGAPVRRRDAAGPFTERLDVHAVHPFSVIGVPVLDGHRQTGSEHIVGTVVDARHEDGALVAIIRLSTATDVASTVTKVAEGILRGVSVGYQVAAWEDSKDSAGARLRTARAWRVVEVSLVGVPADSAAIIRSETMSDEPKTPSNDNAMEHRAQVRAIARAAGQPATWADEQIDADRDIVAVRAAAFEAMTTRQSPRIQTQTAAPANDDPTVILARRANALFARINGAAPEDSARVYFNDGLVDHARAIIAATGASVTGMDRETLLRTAMHTTSDFPNLLTGVGNRTLAPSYQAAQSPLKAIARQALHTDFRTASRIKLGGIGQLQKVSEAGEIKSTSRAEATESYALDTYASLFNLSRKALINDDLGAFRDWGIAAGRAAAETEAALLFGLLTQANGAGPIMGEDGKRMFHADHGNLAIGTFLGLESLSEGRLALRRTKGFDGKSFISVAPKFLLVGPEIETIAEQMIADMTAANSGDVNPFAGKLSLLVEPRLSGSNFYLFTEPAALAVLEYAYLSSAQGPQMASREGWDVLGMEFRVHLDFGCGVVDYRGAYLMNRLG